MVKRDFTRLTKDEKINGIKATKLPDYFRTKYHGGDVRETFAQLSELTIQLGINMGLSPDDAILWARKLQEAIPRSEFDSWVATLVDGGPSIFMNTLNELKTAYPNGAAGVALVRETDPAKIYVWNGSAWEDFGDYQGFEIKDGGVTTKKLADEVVTPDKTDFLTTVFSENLFDINDTSYNMGIITGDGIGASDTYRTSPLVRLDPGTYSFTSPYGYGSNTTAIAEYDSSGKIIRYFRGTLEESLDPINYYAGNRISFTLDHKAYIRTNAGSFNGANLPKMTLSKGDSLPPTFIPFEKKVYLKDTLMIPESGHFKTSVMDSISEVPTQNLFNGVYQTGYTQSDYIVDSSRYYSTNKLPLPGGSYVFRLYNQSDYGSGGNSVILYDTDGEKIGRIIADTLEVDQSLYYRYLTFTLDEETLVSVNMGSGKSDLDSWMIVPGNQVSDYPTNYIPYSNLVRTFNNDLILNQKMTDQVTKIVENSEITKNNPLFGKKVAWNGDSIMAGAGFTGGFAKIISERNEMVSNNRAVGGGTITAETITQAGVNRHWVSRDVVNMNSDADYAIILVGVNDGSLGVELGEYTIGYEDVYDDTTFCGGVESTCSQLTQRFAGKKIGFIIPHKMATSQKSYVPKLIEGLEKWGIPYLNLYTMVPPLNYITSLKTIYTNNSDGWHPNEDGYRKYYVDKIESWMKTL